MSDTERSPFDPHDFVRRHIGPRRSDVEAMLAEIGLASVDELVDRVIPASIRAGACMDLPAARSEAQTLAELQELASRNRRLRSFIGMGYHECITPPVIRRTVLENPGWYTAYTPPPIAAHSL